MQIIPNILLKGLSAFLLFTSLSSFQKDNGYTITGEIKNMPDGKMILMIPAGTHKSEKPVDSATIKDGKFLFKGEVKNPELFWMQIKGEAYTGFRIMVDNENILVSGRADRKTVNSKESLELLNIKITGSKSNDLFLEKTAFRERLNHLYNAYNENNKTIANEVQQARKNKDSVLYKKLVATEAYNKFQTEEKAFFDTADATIQREVLANKDSWWGPFLMLNQFSYFTPKQKGLYEQFSKEAKDSYYGKVVEAELYPVSHVGKPAPSLAFTDNKNNPVPFGKITEGKKYVVIDFWASWCTPCRRAIPALKDFYKEMRNKGVTIISVSIDQDSSAWAKANHEEKFPWYSFLDRQGISDAYGVRAIPAMFLLDGSGKVVAENVSLEDIREKIN